MRMYEFKDVDGNREAKYYQDEFKKVFKANIGILYFAFVVCNK